MRKNEVDKMWKKRVKDLQWKYKHGLISQEELYNECKELVFVCNKLTNSEDYDILY